MNMTFINRVNSSFLITASLIAAVIIGGVLLRLIPVKSIPSSLVENTLTPYYFDKTQRLINTGEFPKEDIWQWAPSPHPENTPPGLAYISLPFLKIWKIIYPSSSLVEFANIFPVLAFILWCVIALALFKWQKKNPDFMVLFLAVLAFSPVAISLTSFANYTQETIGVFLLFLSIYALSNLLPNWQQGIIVIVIVTTLILTWQQFPILYFGAIPIIGLLAIRKNFKNSALLSAVLLIPLIFSETIVRLFIKNDYSAFSMIKEFALGFWLGFLRDPNMITSMVRGNWRPVGFGEFYQLFGPLTVGLLILGVIVALSRPKELKNQLAIIFGVIGFAMLTMFEKEKNLAFGLFLFPIAIALEKIFESYEVRLPKISLIFGKSDFVKLTVTIVSAIFFISSWYFFTKTPTGIALITKYYPPKPEIIINNEKNPDGTIDVKFRMINRGGTTFYSDELWFGLSSGMHIEICGADILESKAYSPTSEYTWLHYAVYPYSRWGDCYFMEIKFKQLRKNEYGDAYFNINPLLNAKPVVYYRGWMPEASCILRYRNASGETPEEQLMVETEAEPCIIRTPPHNDKNYPICPVQVQAARMDLQDFRCHAEQI